MSSTNLRQAWKGQFSARDGSSIAGGGGEIDPSDVDGVFTGVVHYAKVAADSMAADVTSAQEIFTLDTLTLDNGQVGLFPNGIKIISVLWTSQSNVSANATNYLTMIVEKATGAGSPTTVASLALDTPTTDDLTAIVAKTIPITATAATLTTGQSLRFRTTKTGSGLILQIGRLQVAYRVL